jgi:hypothetical protein
MADVGFAGDPCQWIQEGKEVVLYKYQILLKGQARIGMLSRL